MSIMSNATYEDGDLNYPMNTDYKTLHVPLTGSDRRTHLLMLPYDIRHLVYEHLFPDSQQLYIQAFSTDACVMLPAGMSLPTNLLLVCRQLHREASEFLYNGYLFNLVGTRKDCLRLHKSFLTVLETYARTAPKVDAFSNGAHSSTVCISMQAGSAKADLLRRRGRGQPRELCDLETEEASVKAPRYAWVRMVFPTNGWVFAFGLGGLVLAIIIAGSLR